jgi:phage terminase large subunit GpA-like protein
MLIESCDQTITTCIEAVKKIWTPPPVLTLSEWSDEKAYLSPESSAEPGKWHTIEYQRGPMDAMTDALNERITWMKSARVGYTKCLNNLIGYHIEQDPAPILVVQPTIDDAQGYSKDEIAPMLRDTPALDGLVSDPKTRDSSNTILKKQYPGGVLTIIGANSARGFRRLTVRIVLFDEPDAYPPTAGVEGDQIRLGIKRTETFWNRKIILGSTPTIKGASRIETSFEQSDKRFYNVPCPHCKTFHVLKWKNLKWDPGKPETARFVCPECGAEINEKFKAWMVKNGEWIPTAPFKGHAGFHIWAAYSLFPNAAWGKLAAEFLEVKDDPVTLQTFVNTVLGETWEERGEGVDGLELINRAEKYGTAQAPAGVLCITAGVDVQDNRIECEIVGWGEREQSWSLDYEIIYGDPELSEVWGRLDEILDRQFRRPGGGILKINALGIDTGFATNAVYKYVEKRQVRRVYALKGHAQTGKPIVSRPTKVGIGKKVRLYMVGTDTAKDTIFARLGIETPGPGYCHFPDHYNEDYYQGLTAEEKVIKYKKGVPHREYKKIRTRNEPLDCRVYNIAALYILNPKFKVLAKAIERADEKIKDAQEENAQEKDAQEKEQSRRKGLKRKRKGGFVKRWNQN